MLRWLVYPNAAPTNGQTKGPDLRRSTPAKILGRVARRNYRERRCTVAYGNGQSLRMLLAPWRIEHAEPATAVKDARFRDSFDMGGD